MSSKYINKIIQGSALEVLKDMPSNFVDTCMTSPPYYSKRTYPEDTKIIWGEDKSCEHEWMVYTREANTWSTPSSGIYGVKGEYNKAWIKPREQAICSKCGAWMGQLGLEQSPVKYIDHLFHIFHELKRVLKKTGILFLNIGDSFCGSGMGYDTKEAHVKSFQNPPPKKYPSYYSKPPSSTCIGKEKWLIQKQLMMIPERLAIRMLDDGWILRSRIIWQKAQPTPHPVRDRFLDTYEYVYMFVKSRKYYFNLDKVREPHIWASRDKRSEKRRVKHKSGKSLEGQYSSNAVGYHPKGKNPGDVWKLKTAQSKIKHFAVFPQELVRKCILAGCPEEVCDKCGKPKMLKLKKKGHHLIELGFLPSCRCKEQKFIPGITLDPFAGSGTALIVARQLGLNYIGIELSKKYVSIIEDRLSSKVLSDFI